MPVGVSRIGRPAGDKQAHEGEEGVDKVGARVDGVRNQRLTMTKDPDRPFQGDQAEVAEQAKCDRPQAAAEALPTRPGARFRRHGLIAHAPIVLRLRGQTSGVVRTGLDAKMILAIIYTTALSEREHDTIDGNLDA